MKNRLRAWRSRGELWLAVWLRRYFAWRPRRLEDQGAAPFAVHAFGAASSNPRRIPSIIWGYWSGSAVPLVVQRCFDNWRALNPGFSVRILDAASVRAYIPSIPSALDGVSEAKRADWVRLELLRRHGGIWLDASTILTAPLDWVLARQAEAQCDFVGYYLERYTSDAAYPVVENWFMAAPPESPFIADLQREFSTQVVARGNEGYIAHLQALGVYAQVRQRIDIPHYLSMHLALQFVLRAGSGCRLCLGKAEDGPYYYHALGNWNRAALKIRLLFSRAADAPPPVVKLRKPDRRRLDDYIERGLYLPGSLVGQYLLSNPRSRDATPQDSV
ncbi:capsular polysaccharide synthesis protein [Ramlibacter sp. H39-3-26]|uniref:glycosyltransferase family 32 protein n=1 Tax=Curvibacter soli TaxID=3031331 RepID=UPI0023DB788F|nr:capsular polysaccharide synthesis protein [Ramlibacter sp. H39-3-26]MDF1486079.1 capsular polysaccharide synthesis protein [Ramlibacter sp. H39-3-26]